MEYPSNRLQGRNNLTDDMTAGKSPSSTAGVGRTWPMVMGPQAQIAVGVQLGTGTQESRPSHDTARELPGENWVWRLCRRVSPHPANRARGGSSLSKRTCSEVLLLHSGGCN